MGIGESLMVFAEIVLINLLLSGDNAIVIAMAARRLPPDKRQSAVWWGTLAAVVLRCGLTLAAVKLLGIPFMQTAGALLLFAIALKLMLDNHGGAEIERRSAKNTLIGAVWTIVAADFVMSLDNVLAIAAIARGDAVLLFIGIAMSIPIMIWGSSFIMRMLDRLPFLVYIGGALLAYAAGDMLMKDPAWARRLPQAADQFTHAAPYAAAALLISCALWLKRRRRA
ncbi:TerC family protein [Cohnella lubricantis]|uniref:TerC family protein n=1 Tax=Cohnella lubricantis TaxID=2163172 RepID=A0A841TF64_9BACL|nr:TerC family protein [Cohnella lubricantis]MBB6678715.1 TerC family protein [Cohnella lubricantis]MBP2119784.1 YjbE family integral membrane protein [Cohnella lubricantis]